MVTSSNEPIAGITAFNAMAQTGGASWTGSFVGSCLTCCQIGRPTRMAESSDRLPLKTMLLSTGRALATVVNPVEARRRDDREFWARLGRNGARRSETETSRRTEVLEVVARTGDRTQKGRYPKMESLTQLRGGDHIAHHAGSTGQIATLADPTISGCGAPCFVKWDSLQTAFVGSMSYLNSGPSERLESEKP